MEKGLPLGKANFSSKGYKINDQKFPYNPNNVALLSGKEKKKVNDLNDDQPI